MSADIINLSLVFKVWVTNRPKWTYCYKY